MIVWLWDAGSRRGISGDEGRARQAAETCLIAGQATVARVERAVTVLGSRSLVMTYQRLGCGWDARRISSGISWMMFASLLIVSFRVQSD